MHKISYTAFLLFLSTLSTLAFAGPPPLASTPEIDAGSALLGIGLLAGIVGLFIEYRRK